MTWQMKLHVENELAFLCESFLFISLSSSLSLLPLALKLHPSHSRASPSHSRASPSFALNLRLREMKRSGSTISGKASSNPYVGTTERAEAVFPICRCGEVATMKFSRTLANPGRRFYSCANYWRNKSCGFFRWVDPPLADEVKNVISGIVKEKEEEWNKAKRRANVLLGVLIVVVVLHVFKFVLN